MCPPVHVLAGHSLGAVINAAHSPMPRLVCMPALPSKSGRTNEPVGEGERRDSCVHVMFRRPDEQRLTGMESGSGWPPGSGSAGAADTNVHCPLAPRAAVGNGTVVGRGARRNRSAAVGLAVFCFCQSQVTVSVVRPVPAAHELNDLRAGEARGLVRSAFARGSCEVLFLSTGSQVELLLREVPKIS